MIIASPDTRKVIDERDGGRVRGERDGGTQRERKRETVRQRGKKRRKVAT